MFHLFRSSAKLTKILLAGVMLVLALSMVMYLIPNAGLTAANDNGVDNVLAEVGGTTVTADQAKAAIGYLQAIGNDLQMLFGDVSKLWVIVGPVIIALVAKWGLYAASLKGQLSSIARNPNVDISGQIKVPPPVAAAVPSDKVVPK